MRINELPREERLLLIEETRIIRGSEWTDWCVENNVKIGQAVVWDDTRQGHKYWSLIDQIKE
jgi:hypothetical protein